MVWTSLIITTTYLSLLYLIFQNWKRKQEIRSLSDGIILFCEEYTRRLVEATDITRVNEKALLNLSTEIFDKLNLLYGIVIKEKEEGTEESLEDILGHLVVPGENLKVKKLDDNETMMLGDIIPPA